MDRPDFAGAMVAVCSPDSEVAWVEAVRPDFAGVLAVVERLARVVHVSANIEMVAAQAEQAQPEIAAPSGQDYPVHIASHNRAAVPMAPAVARVVVVLRLPLSHSIC